MIKADVHCSARDIAFVMMPVPPGTMKIFLVFFMKVPGLPRAGKNIWKIKFFSGQGKVREFC